MDRGLSRAGRGRGVRQTDNPHRPLRRVGYQLRLQGQPAHDQRSSRLADQLRLAGDRRGAPLARDQLWRSRRLRRQRRCGRGERSGWPRCARTSGRHRSAHVRLLQRQPGNSRHADRHGRVGRLFRHLDCPQQRRPEPGDQTAGKRRRSVRQRHLLDPAPEWTRRRHLPGADCGRERIPYGWQPRLQLPGGPVHQRGGTATQHVRRLVESHRCQLGGRLRRLHDDLRAGVRRQRGRLKKHPRRGVEGPDRQGLLGKHPQHERSVGPVQQGLLAAADADPPDRRSWHRLGGLEQGCRRWWR